MHSPSRGRLLPRVVAVAVEAEVVHLRLLEEVVEEAAGVPPYRRVVVVAVVPAAERKGLLPLVLVAAMGELVEEERGHLSVVMGAGQVRWSAAVVAEVVRARSWGVAVVPNPLAEAQGRAA